MSVAKKSFLLDLLVIFLGLIGMALLKLVPYNDLLQMGLFVLIGSYVAFRTYEYRKASSVPDVNRYEDVSDEIYQVRKAEDAYETSNMLLSGDIPLWWAIETLWDKTVASLGLKPEEIATLDDWGKIRKIKSVVPHVHLLDLFCLIGDKMGRGIVRAERFIASLGENFSLSVLDAKLKEMGEKAFAILLPVGPRAFFADVKQGQQPVWVLSFNLAIDAMLAFYPVRKIGADGKVFWQTGARVSFAKGIFTPELGAKFLEAFKIFRRENLASGPNEKGLFMQERKLMTEADLVQLRSDFAKFVVALPALLARIVAEKK
ncbi:MAG: hypothetical protein G01um101418_1001 [Parcubacteria group bacterium Gr01-1014_18]|nr:MAG: hypothetical protein Greene041636_992 [Parcubacteria group bacterium Greene0416_36]TSC79327.1 MAG: hypothetical protein G01um101418_1001 [Parcubacteria group bacterium Gr01-1014_18]TSD05950.1 MAG: hypothetical protein Greene07142_985 [Parcubacteria group bacterium Greene0714_2]